MDEAAVCFGGGTGMLVVKRRLSIETYVIAAIGLVDLFLTIALVQGQRAYEGNPIMNFYLSHGMTPFVMMKLVLTAMPLLILEWARRTRPDFVRRLSRVGIGLYLGAYGFGFLKVNLPTLLASRTPTESAAPTPAEIQTARADLMTTWQRP
jgi:hypothetical protein